MTEAIMRAEIDMTGYNVGNDLAMQGQLAIRWAKLTYIGDRLVSREVHRTELHPEDEIDETMAAIRDDLARQGYAWDVYDSDVAFVKSLAERFWTPEIRAAREAQLAATPANPGQSA